MSAHFILCIFSFFVYLCIYLFLRPYFYQDSSFINIVAHLMFVASLTAYVTSFL
jgi:hypothetical protein